MRRSSLIMVVGVWFMACNSAPNATSGECNANVDCRGGFACVDGECRQVCESDSQCGDGFICVDAICEQGERELSPVIIGLDGDSDVECPTSDATHCIGYGLQILGENLEGANFSLTATDINASQSFALDIREISPTRAVVDLPAEIDATIDEQKTYMLAATNQAGSDEMATTLLRGEPGEAFSPSPDQVIEDFINQADAYIDPARVHPTFIKDASVAPGDSLKIEHPDVPGFAFHATVLRAIEGGGYEVADLAPADASEDQLEFGSGADGPITISGTMSMDEADLGGYAFEVAEINGPNELFLEEDPQDQLADGDEVLLISMQGSASGYQNVGNYEFLRVDSVSGNTVTFAQSKKRSYGEAAGSDANVGSESVVLERVQNVPQVTLAPGSTLEPARWDGTKGGIVAFRASEGVVFQGDAQINATALGYRGGACGPNNEETCGDNVPGHQGEGVAGPGAGEHPDNLSANVNGGGGGHGPVDAGGSPGAGGGHGTRGGDGRADIRDRDSTGGEPVGDLWLTSLFMGGGGGGPGDDDNDTQEVGAIPRGGAGGGIIFIAAPAISGANVYANGAAATCVNNGGSGGTGGGAGGSIYLQAYTLDLDDVTAEGGASCADPVDSDVGGAGGEGRIRLDFNTKVGVTRPPAAEKIQVTSGVTVTARDEETVEIRNVGRETEDLKAILTVYP